MKVLYTDVYSPSAEELDTHYLRAPGELKAPVQMPALTYDPPPPLTMELAPPRLKRPTATAVIKRGKSSLF
jgi:hypothetical protein